MNLRLLLVFVALLVAATLVHAQNMVKTQSKGSNIVLTVWDTETPPTATVLLVPGWGGGPNDALGIASSLSEAGVATVVLSPRGWHGSDGIASFANALDDIEAALTWVRDPSNSSNFNLNANEVVLGGYSWGGGMSLAYAARDTSVRRVFSVAGTDHGQFIRQYETDTSFASMVDAILASTAAPKGAIEFDVATCLDEMKQGQEIYGLVENADHLASRSVLLFGGWEDVNVTVDLTLLPFYRALRVAGAKDVTFITYHTDHRFAEVRSRLHMDLIEWTGGKK